MLSVLNIGTGYPEEELDLQFLSAVSGVPCDYPGKRYSSLPRSYILETGNIDPSKAPSAALSTPTKIGSIALKNACARGGVSPESLGLIIGDTATPLQTTPSEAQRITGAFSLRIPCFDLTALSCAFSAQLAALSRWRPEKLPEYIALISTNTPSLSINYREGKESLIFGDGASVLLLSRVHQGKLTVMDAYYGTKPLDPSFLTLDTYGFLKIGTPPTKDLIEEKLALLAKRFISSCGKSGSRTFVVLPPQFEEISKAHLSRSLSEYSPEFLSLYEKTGDTLGGYAGGVIYSIWDDLKPNDRVFVVQFGSSLGYGSLLLGAN